MVSFFTKAAPALNTCKHRCEGLKFVCQDACLRACVFLCKLVLNVLNETWGWTKCVCVHIVKNGERLLT